MVSRKYRLQSNRDVRRVQQKGKKLSGRNLRIQILPNRSGHIRFTVIVGTKTIKHATDRNRVKRQIRAQFDQFIKDNPALAFDLCVYVSNYGAGVDIKQECMELFGQIQKV
ncbi:MAG: ribonuclease P protein component [Patescibacteria group bacterium]|jgi:ribonuclease P protein component